MDRRLRFEIRQAARSFPRQLAVHDDRGSVSPETPLKLRRLSSSLSAAAAGSSRAAAGSVDSNVSPTTKATLVKIRTPAVRGADHCPAGITTTSGSPGQDVMPLCPAFLTAMRRLEQGRSEHGEWYLVCTVEPRLSSWQATRSMIDPPPRPHRLEGTGAPNQVTASPIAQCFGADPILPRSAKPCRLDPQSLSPLSPCYTVSRRPLPSRRRVRLAIRARRLNRCVHFLGLRKGLVTR